MYKSKSRKSLFGLEKSLRPSPLNVGIGFVEHQSIIKISMGDSKMRRARSWLLGTSALVVLGGAGCGTGATGTTSAGAGKISAPGLEATVGANRDRLTVITSPKGNFADNFSPFDPSTKESGDVDWAGIDIPDIRSGSS